MEPPEKPLIPARLRDAWLTATDDELLRACEIDTYRASGPGGQHRNKTSSAVRLRHAASGQLVIAEDSRSQHENKARAVKRLRKAIALHVRCPVEESSTLSLIGEYRTPDGGIQISIRSPDYPRLIAAVLDVFAQNEGSLRETAERVGISSSQLGKFVTGEGKLLAAANLIRAEMGLRPLRASD